MKVKSETFGSTPFSNNQKLSDTLNKKLGPEFLSERAGPGGKKVHYLEGAPNILI
jgi:recombination DNA repair RAD52 pathway protein